MRLHKKLKELRKTSSEYSTKKIKRALDKIIKHEERIIKLHIKKLKIEEMRLRYSDKKVKLYKLFDLRHYYKLIVDFFIRRPQMVVMMINRNNEMSFFHIYTDVPKFKYSSGTYVIDTKQVLYSPTFESKFLMYHIDCSVPINFDFKISSVQDAIKSSKYVTVEGSFNPRSLLTFQKAHMTEEFVRGATQGRSLPILLILIGVNIILSLVMSYYMFNGGF